MQLAEVGQQIERVEERLRSTEDIVDLYSEAKAALDRTRVALDELRRREESTRTAWVRDGQDAKTKRLALLDQYADLRQHRERIEQAGPDGKCPTCARPLGSEYELVLETLSTQLEEIKANGTYYKARVAQLEREPGESVEARRERKAGAKSHELAVQYATEMEAQIQQRQEWERDLREQGKRVTTLEQSLASLTDTYDTERHDAVRKLMRDLEPILQEATRLQVRADHAERLVGEAEVAERTLSQREERVRKLTETIAAFGFSEDAYQEARIRHERAVQELRDVELRAESIKGDEKAALVGLESTERRMRERRERAEKSDALRKDARLPRY